MSSDKTVYLSYDIREKAILVELGNSSIISNYRDKLLFSMAGHTLRRAKAGGLQRGRALKIMSCGVLSSLANMVHI